MFFALLESYMSGWVRDAGNFPLLPPQAPDHSRYREGAPAAIALAAPVFSEAMMSFAHQLGSLGNLLAS